MTAGRWIVAALVVAAGGFGWYYFRPELAFVDAHVAEELTSDPMASSVALRRGDFHGVAHEGRGTATVYQLADDKRILRLTDFEVSNGPDVLVYLVAADDAKDDDTVKQSEFVSLGFLKGNIGDQNYEIPADVDVDKYRSVSIWCRRFGVNFAAAPLALVSE